MCEICENMATYEGKLKSMKTKIKLLKLTDEETQRTIEKGDVPSLERQQRVLKTKLEEVYSLKVEIQEHKFKVTRRQIIYVSGARISTAS